MASWTLHSFPCNDVAFSPFLDNTIAVAQAENFGLSGRGRLDFVRTDPVTKRGKVDVSFASPAGVSQLSWSRCSPHQAVVSCMDGSARLYDRRAVPSPDGFVRPIAVFGALAPPSLPLAATAGSQTAAAAPAPSPAHAPGPSADMSAIAWQRPGPSGYSAPCTQIATGWGDGRLSLWDVTSLRAPLLTGAPGGGGVPSGGAGPGVGSTAGVAPAGRAGGSAKKGVQEIAWGPGGQLGAVTEAGDILVLDPREGLKGGLQLGGRGTGAGGGSAPSHPRVEQTSCDWRQDRPGLLATAGVDAAVRVWDVRWPAAPAARLSGGHTLALLKVRWDPVGAGRLLTCGYDRAVCVWAAGEGGGSTGGGKGAGGAWGSAAVAPMNPVPTAGDVPSVGWKLLGRLYHHKEFVRSVAWSPLAGAAGTVASCGWDGVSVAWRGCNLDARGAGEAVAASNPDSKASAGGGAAATGGAGGK